MGLLAFLKDPLGVKARRRRRNKDEGLLRAIHLRLDKVEGTAKYWEERCRELEKVLRARTTAHVDVGMKGSTVILIGHYNGADYVEAIEVSHQEFTELVKMVQGCACYARPGRIDVPAAMRPMAGAIKDEIFAPFESTGDWGSATEPFEV